jgi:phosphatidylserine/phosphatidylglycerophosphate/cardiolipin synthase-like enzyme
MPERLPNRRLVIAGLVLACSTAAALPAAPPAAKPAIELVETVPVETRLGNPELPRAAAVWTEMIDGARRTLDLEHFYLSHWPGEPTGPVLDAIGRAAGRGVRVRLILDAGMHATYPLPADSLARVPGIAVRLIDMKKVSGSGVQHAKYFVADGEQVFVGSQNLDWRALEHIHELGVRARDPRIAAHFARVFESDWRVSTPIGAADTSARTGSSGDGAGRAAAPRAPSDASTAEPGPLPPLPIRIARSPGDTIAVWPSFSPKGQIPEGSLWDLDAIVRLLDRARGEAVVQLLSYGSGRSGGRDSTLDEALRRAAGRGVKVRLLISDWQADNARIGDLQSLARVPNVEARLSSVPEWSGGYIPFARVEHCKYLVVDTLWTWVGTSNWEPGYFHGSRNAALTMRDRRLARQAREVFDVSWRARTARVVRAGETYAPRIHRETPPPGRTVYGR